ncbi:winged helix-turn-helix domain-containing protein [Enterococcus ureasiticus]|uniref:OmpR/PhoB-type domain-containing protein n=1 Tax=Enterococcus ureasiticus TaxID=903984 RepID=A0A1E5GNL0_9ENTE|nr:winged helix-turn-helix domain-containing protein [Enterococcus ureasiticus]OEG14289.1 hypothetical protein BCR21_04670 [Enterococcus ureasiticus]
MTTIGLIQLSGEFKSQQQNYFKESDVQFKFCKVSDNHNRFSDFDGIVIVDNEQTNMIHVCQWILTIRKNSNCFICVQSNSLTSENRLFLLQLGASIIVDIEHQTEEEIYWTIHNFFNVEKDNHQVGGINLNQANRNIEFSDGKVVELTNLEFQLMGLFVEFNNRTLDYDKISKRIWGNIDAVEKNRIVNLVFHLRDKLESAGSCPGKIRNIHGKGYMFSMMPG